MLCGEFLTVPEYCPRETQCITLSGSTTGGGTPDVQGPPLALTLIRKLSFKNHMMRPNEDSLGANRSRPGQSAARSAADPTVLQTASHGEL